MLDPVNGLFRRDDVVGHHPEVRHRRVVAVELRKDRGGGRVADIGDRKALFDERPVLLEPVRARAAKAVDAEPPRYSGSAARRRASANAPAEATLTCGETPTPSIRCPAAV